MRGVLAVLALILARDAAAQGYSVSAGRHLGSPARTHYSGGYTPWRLGPFDLSFTGHIIEGHDGDRYGLGGELGILRLAGFRPYAVGGLAAGVSQGTGRAFWTGSSLGLGYDVLRLGPLALQAEGRYSRFSSAESALSLGARMSLALGRFRVRSRAAPVARGLGAPIALPPERAALVKDIVQTALEAVGTPYVWGGTDANGFDCSGLIHHAYRTHGVLIPRRSADQAREGIEVGRDPFGLAPGDILTFAIGGRDVTHVGLYLGEGRFLHSASGGVGESTLRPTDPSGRYWWDRWVGARRIVR